MFISNSHLTSQPILNDVITTGTILIQIHHQMQQLKSFDLL